MLPGWMLTYIHILIFSIFSMSTDVFTACQHATRLLPASDYIFIHCIQRINMILSHRLHLSVSCLKLCSRLFFIFIFVKMQKGVIEIRDKFILVIQPISNIIHVTSYMCAVHFCFVLYVLFLIKLKKLNTKCVKRVLQNSRPNKT